jgi:tRNA(Ile)-lysidine synthase
MRLGGIVLRTLRDHAPMGAGDAILLAVSGGADSVAMLWLLRELETAGDLVAKLAGLVHVNHRIRGDESDRDEAFCRSLAERAALPIEVFGVDTLSAAKSSRRSIESAARALRYDCFATAAVRLRANRIATAHTLDDQAETVLLRLFRGAGARGVSGIRVRRGPFVRPLLGCRRDEVRRYLAARGEPYCDDSSNQSLTIARNRVRHLVLPAIQDFAPSAIPAIARFAALAEADERYLTREAEAAGAGVIGPAGVNRNLEPGGVVQLDVEGLRTLPLAIGRRVVRLAGERLVPEGTLTATSIDRILRFASGPVAPRRMDLPQLVVERGSGLVMLRRRSTAEDDAGESVEFECRFDVPGSVELPGGRVITAELVRGVSAATLTSYSGECAAVAVSAVEFPLGVRSRREGDRFRPLGAPGRRKLKDVLIDRRIPRLERDAIPIVVDARGRLVWVAGVTIAHDCRVTTPDTGVVVLKLGRSRVEPGA